MNLIQITIISTTVGKEFLRRYGGDLIVNERVQNEALGCNLKKNRTISVFLQGKPFNIRVLQLYGPTSNDKETEMKWFYEDL